MRSSRLRGTSGSPAAAGRPFGLAAVLVGIQRPRSRIGRRPAAAGTLRTMAEPRSAFVTGGSGFIGGRLIRRLVGDGWRVRALARSDGSATAVEAAGAEAVRGELDEVEAMRAGAEGCAVTFHAAAYVRDWGKRADFE